MAKGLAVGRNSLNETFSEYPPNMNVALCARRDLPCIRIDGVHLGQIVLTNEENLAVYKMEVGINPNTNKWSLILHIDIDGTFYKSYIDINLVAES